MSSAPVTSSLGTSPASISSGLRGAVFTFDRARSKVKTAPLSPEDIDAGDVPREEVTGALDTPELSPADRRQRTRQSRLSDSRYVLKEKMALGPSSP